MYEDTIAAISTPPGEGGIGIVRISGTGAHQIGLRVFRFAGAVQEPESHRFYYGNIVNPADGEEVDEALVAFMAAPRTYTREDVVELNCHGGIIALTKTLRLVLSAGARLAEPGEFTQRAFINGRIDLAQAEAVMEVVRAKTDAAMALGLSQLKGALSLQVQEIRSRILSVLVRIEAAVDFPEHPEVEEMARQQAVNAVDAARAETEALLATADQGRIVRDGLRTAIVGRPNVGKSSLLNALLQEQRAIVTATPGTTRDVIEESLNMQGLALTVLDTAGIRKTRGQVERIGVERSFKAIKEADLLLLVVEAKRGLTDEDGAILQAAKEKPVIVIANKTDLLASPEPDKEEIAGKIRPYPVVFTSLRENSGLEDLAAAILEQAYSGRIAAGESPLIASVRHQDALRRAALSLESAREALTAGMELEMMAIDLYDAAQALGEITGETARPDVVEEIFRSFCIGK